MVWITESRATVTIQRQINQEDMMKETKEKAEVFIVESLELDDEVEGRLEGKVLTEMLRLGGKKPLYFYVRRKQELKEVLQLFKESNYRYLHLSCHGNEESIFTTLDEIQFKELGMFLNPHLEEKRLFMSSCETVNHRLARAIIPSSGCISISGPTVKVNIDAAAILWVSFYHWMFQKDEGRMAGTDIRYILKQLAGLFEVSLAYCVSNASMKRGYRFLHFRGDTHTTEQPSNKRQVS